MCTVPSSVASMKGERARPSRRRPAARARELCSRISVRRHGGALTLGVFVNGSTETHYAQAPTIGHGHDHSTVVTTVLTATFHRISLPERSVRRGARLCSKSGPQVVQRACSLGLGFILPRRVLRELVHRHASAVRGYRTERARAHASPKCQDPLCSHQLPHDVQ